MYVSDMTPKVHNNNLFHVNTRSIITLGHTIVNICAQRMRFLMPAEQGFGSR